MRCPLLVKIAPDLTQRDKEDIAAVVSRNNVCSVNVDNKTSNNNNNNNNVIIIAKIGKILALY